MYCKSHRSVFLNLQTDPDLFRVTSITDTIAKVTVRGELDYETRDAYIINITAHSTHDSSILLTSTFDITVDNINEAPTGIALTVSEVTENMNPASVLGFFEVTDPDDLKDTVEVFSCHLVDSAGDWFQVTQGVQLQVGTSHGEGGATTVVLVMGRVGQQQQRVISYSQIRMLY